MGACKKYMNLEKLKEYAINAATNAGKFLNSNNQRYSHKKRYKFLIFLL